MDKPKPDSRLQFEKLANVVSQAMATNTEARRLVEQKLDYELAVNLLERIPDWLRDRTLYQTATSIRDQLRNLDDSLIKAISDGAQDDAHEVIVEILQLLPNHEGLKQVLATFPEANAEARELVERQLDYESAVKLLLQIPQWVRDANLYQVAVSCRDRVRRLNEWLFEARREGTQEEMCAIALELLELLPGRDDLKHLIETAPSSAAVQTVRLAEKLENSIGMLFALVPRGKFFMGDASDIQRRVWMRTPFYIGVVPVTQTAYLRVTGTNPSWFSLNGGGSNVAPPDTQLLPVEDVYYQDAEQFCRKLSDLPTERAAGRRYRLPTETEWEYACRAGTTTPYWFGDTLTAVDANCDRQIGRTTIVGSYPANAFGLYDMHGNVWEWCQASDDEERCLRGGSWMSFSTWACAARRFIYKPGGRINDGFGFRVVCDLVVDSPL